MGAGRLGDATVELAWCFNQGIIGDVEFSGDASFQEWVRNGRSEISIESRSLGWTIGLP